MSKTWRVTVNGAEPFEVQSPSDTPQAAATAPSATPQESLLQSMERAGLETHYHCRSGFCGACRTHLKSGQVAYITEPLAFVRPGDILPCVCVATSDLELDH